MSHYEQELQELAAGGEHARLEKASQLHERIVAKCTGGSAANWELGRDLSFMHGAQLWRGMADSWREYVNMLGITQPAESMLRNNYRFYIEELGFALDDPRLLSAAETKLALGTRRAFKAWVREDFERAALEREPFLVEMRRYQERLEEADPLARRRLQERIAAIYEAMNEKVQDFVDQCQTGEGSLTRADLRRWLEEQVGIESKSHTSALRDAFETIRDAKSASDSLTDDEWLEFVNALREDEHTSDWLVRVARFIREAESPITVSVGGQ